MSNKPMLLVRYFSLPEKRGKWCLTIVQELARDAKHTQIFVSICLCVPKCFVSINKMYSLSRLLLHKQIITA